MKNASTLAMFMKPLVNKHSELENGPVEIVDFPIEIVDIFYSYVTNYPRVTYKSSNLWLVQHSFSMFDFFWVVACLNPFPINRNTPKKPW